MKKIQYDDMEIIKISVNPFYRMMTFYLYFIDGVLIDAGPSIRRRSLVPIFKSWDIRHVAITHHHEDHAGMASWIAKHSSAAILGHEKTVSILNQKAHLPWYRKLFSGSRHPLKAKPYTEAIQTTKYEFYPIETPGHTADHVSIWEPNKGWLFTGDLYITPYPKVFMKEESISAYIDSLQKLSQLDYETVFCAHQGIIPNGKDMLKQKLDYLQNIKSDVIALHETGLSDLEIRRKMFPEQVRLEKVSFGSFSRRNLIRSCYQENS